MIELRVHHVVLSIVVDPILRGRQQLLGPKYNWAICVVSMFPHPQRSSFEQPRNVSFVLFGQPHLNSLTSSKQTVTVLKPFPRPYAKATDTCSSHQKTCIILRPLPAFNPSSSVNRYQYQRHAHQNHLHCNRRNCTLGRGWASSLRHLSGWLRGGRDGPLLNVNHDDFQCRFYPHLLRH